MIQCYCIGGNSALQVIQNPLQENAQLRAAALAHGAGEHHVTPMLPSL